MKAQPAAPPLQVPCPICGTRARWQGNPYRPFCSRRCQWEDRAAWVDERYVVVEQDFSGFTGEIPEDE